MIREAEVETITKSIQGKLNEVRRTMTQPTDTTTMPLPPNSIPSDQDVTTVNSEIFKVYFVITYCDWWLYDFFIPHSIRNLTMLLLLLLKRTSICQKHLYPAL